MKILPKVSIAIITYNQERFIRSAIEYAVAQDYPNLEVVVADDCSKDSTRNIIDELSEKYPGIVMPIFGETNLGVTGNSNRALFACTGEFICLQGGDDLMLPSKIRKQVEWFLADDERVMCAHEVEVFYEDCSREPHLSKPHRETSVVRMIAEGVPASASSVMVRAKSVPSYGFDPTLKVMSDYMLWIDILAQGGKYGVVEGVYARCRRHSSNVTNNPLKYMDDYLNTYRLTAIRHPHLSIYCKRAINRNYHYLKGTLLIKAGKKSQARQHLKESIRGEPAFLKGWARLIQSWM